MIYFIGATWVQAALYVAMRCGKGDVVSTALLSITSAAAWSLIPLVDGLPERLMRPKVFRTILVLMMLQKGYLLVWCVASAARCHAYFNDFSWQRPVEGSYSGPGMGFLHPKSIALNSNQTPDATPGVVSVGWTNNNNITVLAGYTCPKLVNEANWLGSQKGPHTFSVTQSGAVVRVKRTDGPPGWSFYLQFLCWNSTSANSTSPDITFSQEPVLSTLDIYNSIHSTMIVLLLTILASSLKSPDRTVCIRDTLKLTDLHGEANEPSVGSIASKLFGEKIGRRHAMLVRRFGKWAILLGVAAEVVVNAPASMLLLPDAPASRYIKYGMATCAMAILCCLWGPALHARTCRKLWTTPTCWYYICLLVAGGVCQALRDANRNVAIHEVVHAFVYTSVLLILLPAMDAIPPPLFPQWLRLVIFGFISVLFLFLFVEARTVLGHEGPANPKGESHTQ